MGDRNNLAWHFSEHKQNERMELFADVASSAPLPLFGSASSGELGAAVPERGQADRTSLLDLDATALNRPGS